jgi:SAM-dependent methyltransferase
MPSRRPAWVLKQTKGKKRILDIGFLGEIAHDSSLHKKIREQNPNAYVAGLDTNKEALANCPFENCFHGSFLEMPFENDSFDTVILCEVIEHVPDSLQGFAEISRILKPGGELILTTPSAYGFFRWLKHWILTSKPTSRPNYRNFLGDHDHKLFWEPLSLCNLLAMNNLEVTKLTTRNLSLPYLPHSWRNPALHFWPFTRMGTYLCIVARKV